MSDGPMLFQHFSRTRFEHSIHAYYDGVKTTLSMV
jgi:hypothetical protein